MNPAWIDRRLPFHICDQLPDELDIVDHEHVDRAEELLEVDHPLFAQGGDEAVHELLGREVEHGSEFGIAARVGQYL
jgi:hypothetical protein